MAERQRDRSRIAHSPSVRNAGTGNQAALLDARFAALQFGKGDTERTELLRRIARSDEEILSKDDGLRIVG